MQEALSNHLKTGSTTVCRAWKVKRRDGLVLGFTDHDRDLSFDGVTYLARTGLTARSLQQTTGLSVDNTEAMGALSDASVREEDIIAGRFDGAEVTAYLVNWENAAEHSVLFKGSFGEIVRTKGTFQVELRGLTERLNLPVGRVYHAECSALLGDRQCTVDLSLPAHSVLADILSVEGGRVFHLPLLAGYAPHWFERGQLTLLDGIGKDLAGIIRADRIIAGNRVIELWQGISAEVAPGDTLRLEAGCDKRSTTCRDKFANFLNFRGFPHIPGEDWLRAAPSTQSGG